MGQVELQSLKFLKAKLNMKKEELLDTEFFEDNEFLDSYLNLVNSKSNEVEKHEPYQIEKHHIIPKSYYKLKGFKLQRRRFDPVVDRKENLVFLTCYEHLLAHYYLALCSKGELKGLLSYSFISMVDKNSSILSKNISKEQLEKELLYYSLIREERNLYISNQAKKRNPLSRFDIASYCRKHKWTEEEKERLREGKKKAGLSRKGKVYITDGVSSKLVSKEEALHLESGWRRGVTKSLSPHQIAKKGQNTRKLKKSLGECYEFIFLTNGKENKVIRKTKKEEIEALKKEGFWEGRTLKKKSLNANTRLQKSLKMRGSKMFYKKEGEKIILKRFKKEEEALQEGWKRGNPLLTERNKKMWKERKNDFKD